MTDAEGVEVLVHIEAPSKATDDVYYRALAAAYIGFRPVSRTNLASPSPDDQNPAAVRVDQSPDRPRGGEDAEQANRSFGSLMSAGLSFESVWENKSPPVRITEEHPEEPPSSARNDSQTSWHTLPSVIEDSNPHNDLHIAAFCSPTRVLESYLRPVGSPSKHAPKGRSGQSVSAEDTKKPEDVIAATSSSQPRSELATELASVEAADEEDRIPSTFPESQTSSQAAALPPSAEDSLIRTPSSPRASLTKRPCSASPRADSEPPSNKRLRHVAAVERSPHLLPRSTSDIGPCTSRVLSSQPVPSSQASLEFLDHLEVRPPPPPVGILDMDSSHVLAEQLEVLARQLDLKQRFRPAIQKRELRPLERGYWLVDCSGWEGDLPQRTWGFLWNYVRGGTAGWGVWCRRDEKWSWIRTYCWGSIVGHIYLLLYVASDRQILFTGGSWFGGDGEIVIKMGIRKPE